MKVIGLTGGIASGKSTVAQFLKELGAVTIDADRVGHEIFRPESPAWREVVDAFGRDILDAGGEIDRRKLGRLVFGDAKKLARLNQITHPRIYAEVKARIEEYRRRGEKVAVLEAPLLLESDGPSLADDVDEIWVTVAPEATVLKRLKDKTGNTEAHSKARIRSQMPTEARLKRADVVIDTDCPLDELKAKITGLWKRLT
ncbi:MAG: dephospho-CoA kinase [Dehalococcoidia bacterium]|jgi:dephospho-CoA kinase